MEKLKILQDRIPENPSSQNDSQITVNQPEMKICPEHGEYQASMVGHSGRVLPLGCPRCREERFQKQRAEMEERQRSEQIALYIRQSGVPKRHQGKSFEDLDMNYQKSQAHNLELSKAVRVVRGFLDTWPDRLKEGASGFFCGECGTGKTMLAAMMVESVARQGYPAKYTTAWDMIQYIRRSYKTGESTQRFIQEFVRPAILVIDEIGVQSGSQDERVLMYQVIDGRYNEVRPTILISNSKNPVEDGFLDLRTVDRLNEGGGFSITFNGESYRK